MCKGPELEMCLREGEQKGKLGWVEMVRKEHPQVRVR